MSADVTGVMVRTCASSCSELMESGYSHSLDVFLGEMYTPGVWLVPINIAEASTESVQGRLKGHSSFWLNELEASDFVRGIVQHGYRIPFLAYPAPVFRFNHQSALQNEQFVSSEIGNLLTKDVSFNVRNPHLCVAHFQWLRMTRGSRG